MVLNGNISLEEKRNELLSQLREMIGRGYQFSDAYLKQCYKNGGNGPVLGDDRPYGKITKKYVYVPCRVEYRTNDEYTEFGAYIKKYSVMTTQGNTNKIELEDLFIADLEKIILDIKFSLWWESKRMKSLQAEMKECEEYVKKYKKFCLK